MPTAITSSAPTLTLAGHLEAVLREKSSVGEWSGDPARVAPSEGAAQVAASIQFNPSGKKVSVDQERELQALVNAFDERSRPLHAKERKSTLEALIRAVSMSQFESVDLGQNPGLSDPVAANRFAQATSKATSELMQRMANRLGTPGVDWTWSAISSYEPDGISRQNVVYFLRTNEGEVFRIRDEESALIGERQRAYREFFDRLR